MNISKKLQDKHEIKIGYARVSSTDSRQVLGFEIQKEALANCDIVFTEKESGGQDNRKEFLRAIRLAKRLRSQGSAVSFVIYKLDRLTRKMFTLVDILKDFSEHDIQLISIQENIDTKSLTGKLLVVLLGYVAEMELEAIKSRTKDGLRKAKERGVKLGNPGISHQTEQEIIQLYQKRESVRNIASATKISIATVYNVLHRNNISLKSRK